MGIALSNNFGFAFVAIVLAGAFEMLLGASNLAALQMLAPEVMRGRITSLSQVYPAVISLGSFLVGPLADVTGAPGASMISAGVCLAGMLALWVGSPTLRELRVSAASGPAHRPH